MLKVMNSMAIRKTPVPLHMWCICSVKKHNPVFWYGSSVMARCPRCIIFISKQLIQLWPHQLLPEINHKVDLVKSKIHDYIRRRGLFYTGRIKPYNLGFIKLLQIQAHLGIIQFSGFVFINIESKTEMTFGFHFPWKPKPPMPTTTASVTTTTTNHTDPTDITATCHRQPPPIDHYHQQQLPTATMAHHHRP